MKLIFIILFTFFSLFPLLTDAQGHRIQIKINGLKNSNVLLGYYLGDKKYILDSAKTNQEGIFDFKGEKVLEEGLYILILQNKTFLDFPVTEDQDFAMLTDSAFLVMSLKIKGSKENAAFSDFQKNMTYSQKLSAGLRQRLMNNKSNSDSSRILNDKLQAIKKDLDKFNAKIIRENPNTFTAKFIKATQEIEVPEPPRDAKGNITDSLFQYLYYKNHYFDNIDFTDERLMRSPFLQSKIDIFFNKVAIQIPDSILKEIDALIARAGKNQKMQRFLTAGLLNFYERNKYMGMENVIVGIADAYYFSGKASWADTTFLRKLKDRVEKMRPNLMGKEGPDLQRLETNTGEWASLSMMKTDAIILVFWEPNCNHCQKVMPKLHQLYTKYKEKGLSVFAFYTQHDTVEWKKFIEQHDLTDWINVYDRHNLTNFRNLYDVFTTPTIYILDKKRTIIARKIDVEAIDKFL